MSQLPVAHNQPPVDVTAGGSMCAAGAASSDDGHLAAFHREAAAFERLLPQLLEKCHDSFVAVYGGAAVDDDADELLLAQRVGRNYPNQFVLIRRVSREAQECICLDSPER